MLNLRQLQRDQFAVEEDLRLARARHERYKQEDEHELASDVRRVIIGLELLQETITNRYQTPFSDESAS